jgi:hypothetical protein
MCGHSVEQLQIDGARYLCAEASLILDEMDPSGSRQIKRKFLRRESMSVATSDRPS